MFKKKNISSNFIRTENPQTYTQKAKTNVTLKMFYT